MSPLFLDKGTFSLESLEDDLGLFPVRFVLALVDSGDLKLEAGEGGGDAEAASVSRDARGDNVSREEIGDLGRDSLAAEAIW